MNGFCMASDSIVDDDHDNDEHGPYDSSHDCVLGDDHVEDHECYCGHTW